LEIVAESTELEFVVVESREFVELEDVVCVQV